MQYIIIYPPGEGSWVRVCVCVCVGGVCVCVCGWGVCVCVCVVCGVWCVVCVCVCAPTTMSARYMTCLFWLNDEVEGGETVPWTQCL